MGNIFNGRTQYKDLTEQERIEQMRVSMGNAPVASASVPSQDKVTYGQMPPVQMPNETSQDSKCPSCGGTLSFDPSTGGLVCNFCGSHVQLETMLAEPGIGYSLEDLQNTSRLRYRAGAKQVVCGTCGGQFIAESSSISGLCPYCGSNSINVSGDAAGLLEPTGIVPFKISKDDAQSIFKTWITGRRFSPMDIEKNAQITDLVGVYVPYWVFDCDTYTPYKGKFGRVYGSGDNTYTKYHKSEGVCQLPVKNLTLVATGRLQDDYFWKTISKFNFDQMMKYDPNLLSGFWSESYTVDGPTGWQSAMNRIYEMIRKRIKVIENADSIAKLDMQPSAGNIRAKYVLAPIWITSFDYHGTVYRVLVNGQTGDIVGTWPKSFKRFFMILGIIFGAIFGSQFLLALIRSFAAWIMSLGK